MLPAASGAPVVGPEGYPLDPLLPQPLVPPVIPLVDFHDEDDEHHDDHDKKCHTSEEEAVDKSINIINTFILRTSAAIRVSGTPDADEFLQPILDTFTDEFEFTADNGLSFNNRVTLAEFVDDVAAQIVAETDNSLIANHSVRKYFTDKKGLATVHMDALERVLAQALQPAGSSIISPFSTISR